MPPAVCSCGSCSTHSADFYPRMGRLTRFSGCQRFWCCWPDIGRSFRFIHTTDALTAAHWALHPCHSCACLQEVTNPNVFWYTAPTQIELPFDITGLVAFELFVMHVSGRAERACAARKRG